MIRTALFLALGILPLSGQVRPVTDTVIAAPNATPSLPDHKIVPNDLLSIMVYDEPDLSKPVRVGTDGTIVMSLLKDSLQVEGLLPRQLEDKLKNELVDQQILVHPIVTVAIMDYATHLISVVGDVKTPGQYTITTPITLLDALAKAGWTTTDAGSDLLFSKSDKDAPRKIYIPQIQTMSSDPTINVLLQGGETVNVPDAPKVWVTGNVTKPQAVPIRIPTDATVLKVVASAEGLSQYYGKTAYIYRADAKGVRHEIAIPMKQIIHHKAQDVPLIADDILLIPDDNGTARRAILSEIQTLSGAGASAAIVMGLEK
jgi:polysaccharide biosynthesis/export protein